MNRTDRNNKFYEGLDNPGLILLHDILMTYCMYDFDLGKWLYVFESLFSASSLNKNINYCYVYSHADSLFSQIGQNPLVYVNVI